METPQSQSLDAVDGRIAEKPLAPFLVELLRKRASGDLTITADASVRVLHFQSGMVRFAESNIKSESAGQAQVAAGQIKQASFDRAVALAKQQRVSLHEALAAARVLGPEQLKAALKQQTIDVAVGALNLSAGDYAFVARKLESLNGLPDARVSPVSLIAEWPRRGGDLAAMRAWLEARGPQKLLRSPELEREMFALKASWPGEGVTPLAASGRSLGELLARLKEPELPLVYALCYSGLFTLAGSGVNRGAVHPAAPAAAVAEDKGKVFSPAEHDARRMIFAESERLKDANHYQLLGVLPGAATDQIRAAYFAAARKFHSDAFAGMELGSSRRVAEDLFQRVNEANQVLSSAKDRAEYDVFLDRKAKGLPTDVNAILKAESIFQKGELLFNAGKFEDAELAFREALALNHSEAEFHAYLGMTLFKRRGKAQDGYPHVEKALSMDPRLLSAQVFLSALQSALGEDDAAKKTLRKVLEQDPDNAMAKAEQTRQRAKAEQPKKGGFFGGLFKKS